MTTEFGEYRRLFGAGATPEQIMARATERGDLDSIGRIRMIRLVCGLSLEEAKKLEHLATTGETLEDHQERLAEGLERLLVSDEPGTEN
jgi:hypothetical protein